MLLVTHSMPPKTKLVDSFLSYPADRQTNEGKSITSLAAETKVVDYLIDDGTLSAADCLQPSFSQRCRLLRDAVEVTVVVVAAVARSEFAVRKSARRRHRSSTSFCIPEHLSAVGIGTSRSQDLSLSRAKSRGDEKSYISLIYSCLILQRVLYRTLFVVRRGEISSVVKGFG